MTDPNATPAKPSAEQQDIGSPRPCSLIVGVGASAGGLEAFTSFLSHLPPDSGMAFVLVQHLAPQHPSLLPELLAPHTQMPVRSVVDHMPVAPDHVHLIPPNTTLTIEQGTLHLLAPAEAHGHRLPINHLFHTLAADQGDRAVGIILSGTGTDGTLGLVAIKEHGGMTIAQTPDSAAYDSMPQSAIARGVVDHVLPIAQMPATLLAYAQHVTNPALPIDPGAPHAATAAKLRAICDLLRHATGHDFNHYKPTTLLRRIARRMQVLQIHGFDDYIERLRQDQQEVDQLFRELLISVTHFFRNSEAFEALASKVIPELFRDRGVDTPLRVWVPGCATGEEAYSIAILLREYMARLATPPPVQVFATDIDEQALDIARQGRYDRGVTEYVSAERRARFFVQDERVYQVTKAIREMCLFSVHNLISDPPFARMDLIVCRNLLIYFDADLQRKLIPLLHYALASQGYLFLGPSESLVAHPELFQAVDKQHRIFQRKDVLVRPRVDFPIAHPSRRQLRRYGADRRLPVRSEQDIGELLERILLEQYAPPSVIINEQSEIIFFSGRTGKYLEPPAGAPSQDILAMIHPQLRLALQTAIRATLKERATTIRENLAIETAGAVQRLNLIVQPLSELGPDAGLLLVIFQEIGAPVSTAQARAAGISPQIDEPIAQQLAQELRTTRDALETTIDELQEANTELTLANEELLSLNEELQSANEEQQTSKEETQSLNEELQTVNAELNQKVEELDRVNSDLANLFASTQIPAVFLHADGRIARFTPAATDLFRLIDTDIGRPITDIAPRFSDGDLVELIAKVLRTLAPYDEPVHRVASDTWWMMRIRPYRTLANVIDGVVITFSDITNMKRAEAERERLLEAVQQTRNYAERIVETVREPLLILDANLRVQSANRAFYQMFQTTPVETEQALLYELGDRQWDIPDFRSLLEDIVPRNSSFNEFEVTRDFPRIGRHTMLLNARRLDQDHGMPQMILLSIEDITERMEYQANIRASEIRYRRLFEAAKDGVIILEPETRKILDANPYMTELLGYAREEFLGKELFEIGLLTDREASQAAFRELREKHEIRYEYLPLETRTGHRQEVEVVANLYRENGSQVIQCNIRDISERRRAEEALRESEARFQSIFDQTAAGIAQTDLTGRFVLVNQRYCEIVGYAQEDLLQRRMDDITHPEDIPHNAALFHKLATTGVPYMIEKRYLRRDGSQRWVSNSVSAVRDSSGNPQYLVSVVIDITERKQAAAALQQAHDVLEERVQARTSELAAANTALQAEINERERAEHARQLLLRQLVSAQEEERRRIARELHDQMGQDLTVLMLGLKALRDAVPSDSSVHSRVEPLQALAIQIGREVRTLALQLRPPALDDLGLAATLANYVEQWSAHALVAVDYHTIGLEEQRLPSPIETALYRLAQEALTNVLKHAQATSVSLIIERRADAVHMIVEDDGAGFDVVAARSSAHTEHRLGLVGMDERVAQFGGTLTIESAPGRGTTVFVRIPLRRHADD